MKIMYINSLYDPYVGGGAEITLQNLVHALKNCGADVFVLTIGSQKGIIKEQVDGVSVYRAGIRNFYFHYGKNRVPIWKRSIWHILDIYNPLMKEYIRQVVKIEKPDVASCHNLAGWSISVWDSLHEMGIPIVQVLHDQYLLCPRSTMFKDGATCRRQCIKCYLMRVPHRTKSKKIKAVIGISGFILNKLLAYGYFSNASTKEIIYNTRNFNLMNTPCVQKNEDDIVFGFIGTLAENKGIELLLEVFVRNAMPNWRLKVAGHGKTVYENMLKERYTHPHINFVGYVRQEAFFPTLDVTVVPSAGEEALGMVVAESILFGVPVIGTDRGGVPEMIVEGLNGTIYDSSEPRALVNALTTMAHNIERYRAMKDQIRTSGAAFCDQYAWAKRWYEVYERSLRSDNLSKN